MNNDTTKRLQQAAYVCWVIGITISVYLAVGNQKNDALIGISFAFIILGILLSVIKDRRSQ